MIPQSQLDQLYPASVTNAAQRHAKQTYRYMEGARDAYIARDERTAFACAKRAQEHADWARACLRTCEEQIYNNAIADGIAPHVAHALALALSSEARHHYETAARYARMTYRLHFATQRATVEDSAKWN